MLILVLSIMTKTWELPGLLVPHQDPHQELGHLKMVPPLQVHSLLCKIGFVITLKLIRQSFCVGNFTRNRQILAKMVFLRNLFFQ